MPYIQKQDRSEFRHLLGLLESTFVENPGQLNYLITKLIKVYLMQNGQNYQHYNDCLGALEGAKLELYRRHIAAYEDIKIQENGDV